MAWFSKKSNGRNDGLPFQQEIAAVPAPQAIMRAMPEQAAISQKMADLMKLNQDMDDLVNSQFMFLILEQAQKTESAISATAAYMASLVSSIGEESKVISDFHDSMQALRQLGGNMQDNITGMQELAGGLSALQDKGVLLKDASSEIIRIVEEINALNGHTNLLSLNASIESARAGEAGRGFNVVAGEMRKLSDKTKLSVNGIRRGTENIITQILDVVGSINHLDGLARDKNSSLQDMNGSVVSTIGDIVQISGKMSEIRDRLTQEVEKCTETHRKISTLTEVFDQMSDIAMRMSDLNGTMHANLEEVSLLFSEG